MELNFDDLLVTIQPPCPPAKFCAVFFFHDAVIIHTWGGDFFALFGRN